MTDLQKFDPSTIMQTVRERIQETFVSLIPQDHWEALCKKEVDEFFRDKNTGHYTRTVSDFGKIVMEELTIAAKIKIEEHLEAYDASIWTDDGIKCSAKLQELIVEHAPKIFAATFGNMFQNAINNMKRY